MSLVGRPIIWEDNREEGQDYLTKPTADVLYMNTNEPYTANLDMTGHKIVNVGNPSGDSDAVNKKYVHDNFGLTNYARRDELTNLATKQELQQFVTKPDLADNDRADQRYVNTRVNTRLPLSGGTMAGNINMNNKKITNVAHPSDDADVANKTYVDNSVDTRLSTSGGALTGALNMGGNKITNVSNPTNDSDAVNKKYVYDNFNLSQYARRAELANLATKEELRPFVTRNDLAANDIVDQQYVNTRVQTRLPLSGGVMSGPLNMGINKITNVAYPASNKDCATKEYVDKALCRNVPFMDVYNYPFTGSDNDNVAYRIAIVSITDDGFRDTFPQYVMLSTYCIFVSTSRVDLAVSAKVLEINENVMSVRIQVDNKKGSSWKTAFEVHLQVLIIQPRMRGAATFRSLGDTQVQNSEASNNDINDESNNHVASDDETVKVERPATTSLQSSAPPNARRNIVDSSASYI